ncbi:hypothetical protein CMV_024141 [Castanea mollissima]|uniref:Large ribosomal subunit protein uL4c n=1 Tax=Castanea mollissima TaxID=60419 RepID=A0A8J4QP84_9ROSI|nr:hypothetical protein CMV_024141 [Castanea mollissima]
MKPNSLCSAKTALALSKPSNPIPSIKTQLELKSAPPYTARAVVHQGIVTDLQSKRRDTTSTLTRTEVRGGGEKPYPQKSLTLKAPKLHHRSYTPALPWIIPLENFDLALLSLELEFVKKGTKSEQVDAVLLANQLKKRFMN